MDWLILYAYCIGGCLFFTLEGLVDVKRFNLRYSKDKVLADADTMDRLGLYRLGFRWYLVEDRFE